MPSRSPPGRAGSSSDPRIFHVSSVASIAGGCHGIEDCYAGHCRTRHVQLTEEVVLAVGETTAEPLIAPRVEKPLPLQEVAFVE